MAIYHYQCQYCYCTTSYHQDGDGDAHYGGATGDCGCRSTGFSWDNVSDDEYYDMLNDDD